jgi:fluoride exporter
MVFASRRPVATGTEEFVRVTQTQPAQTLRHTRWDVLSVVALGGVIGASARFGIEVAWPTPAGGFPWATFLINASGCALIGVLMVVTEAKFTNRLVRPLLGTGVLGGFTTFSTYAVEVTRLTGASAFRVAVIYFIATPAVALLAVVLGTAATRRVIRR